MQIHVLASGSSGNAVLVIMGQHRILVDAGISCRRIERGIAELGMKVNDLDAVLLTHEHRDHVAGLDVLIRRYKLPVYTRTETWKNIGCYKNLPPECCQIINKNIAIKDLQIEAFNISHDAVDPVGYAFYAEGQKCVLVTDLGLVTSEVQQAVRGANALVLEANHDLNMLHQGSYPLFLKQRIRGKRGHLSNVDSGKLLCDIFADKPIEVFLAHLSQENNRPAVAEESVQYMLSQAGIKAGKDVVLHRTFPDRTSSLHI